MVGHRKKPAQPTNKPDSASPRLSAAVLAGSPRLAAGVPAGNSPRLAARVPNDSPRLSAGVIFPDRAVSPANDYIQLQEDEVTALQSIYGDDYVERTSSQGAWNKKSFPAFDIVLRERVGGSDETLSLKLRVDFTATYPKTPPVLVLAECDLPAATRAKVQALIEDRPRTLVQSDAPQGIIYDLLDLLREELEASAQAIADGRALPSLEEERERHNHNVQQALQNQRDEEERHRQEEVKEEQLMMRQMVDAEQRRQQQQKQQQRKEVSKTRSWSHRNSGVVQFDRLCTATDHSGNQLTFTAVSRKAEFERGPLSNVYTVLPVLDDDDDDDDSGLVIALKETVIRSDGLDPRELRKQIKTLEEALENYKSRIGPDSKNLLPIFDFKIDWPPINTHGTYTISILSPLASNRSLAALLESSLPTLGKVRDWTRDLLDALNFLHTNHLIHQSIHPRNIVISIEPGGGMVPKLADACYQRQMHSLSSRLRGPVGIGSARSSGWIAPEIAGSSKPQYTPKTDVWDFGVVFLQMIFGLDVVTRHRSPDEFAKSVSLSPQLAELVKRFFAVDSQRRSRPFELSSSAFLATDAPVEAVDKDAAVFAPGSPAAPSPALMPMRMRNRRDSTNRGPIPFQNMASRYETDYIEEGRLGKGGFGEVVKARLKLDGRVCAVKKITQSSKDSLTEVLKEIKVLANINHPSIVRYYHTWLEERPYDGTSSDSDSETEQESHQQTQSDQAPDDNIDLDDIPFEFGHSSGLDFVSSTKRVDMSEDESEEGDDDDEDDDDTEEEEDETASVVIPSHYVGSPAVSAPRFRTTLYISMEYCENGSLRDLIGHGRLHKDKNEIWRLFRQILEGLAHIHSKSIVHRDMKPDNIFLTPGANGLDQVKIGDFGLATSGLFAIDKTAGPDPPLQPLGMTDRFTSNVGTTMYCAPEILTGGQGQYSSKVDMYSLGIIFFEMCHHPMLGMERAVALSALRGEELAFPSDFRPPERSMSDIVMSLLERNPDDRPSSEDLLASGRLPVSVERQLAKNVVASLGDPSSIYRETMIDALFSVPWQPAKDYTYDTIKEPSVAELAGRQMVKGVLVSVFRRHGALETRRSPVYPASRYYPDLEVVRMLDAQGNVVQLPYDLTLGHARVLARASEVVIERCYTFGDVFRDKRDGTQPRAFGVVDFDIVSTDTLDLALREAEVLKVLDEIIVELPSLSANQMCFHLGHSDLLKLVFDFCSIPAEKRKKTADVMSKLNVYGYSFSKARGELRAANLGLSQSTIDELQRFDFRDAPNRAFSKLKALFEGTDFGKRAAPIFAHLKEVAIYAQRLGVVTKIYVNPLTSNNRGNFYNGGMIFTCQHDRNNKEVFAAGGRYDGLIRDLQLPQPDGNDDGRHAVGFYLAWEKLIGVSKTSGKHSKRRNVDTSLLLERRCDVLVASLNPETLRSTGIDILSTLWAHNISAQLAHDERKPDKLTAHARDAGYLWLVIVKDRSLKIKQLAARDAVDVEVSSPDRLVSWIKQALDERLWQANAEIRQQRESDAAPSSNTADFAGRGKPRVVMLVAQNKSKKFNRQAAVESAESAALTLLTPFTGPNGTIISCELSDKTIDMVRQTAVADADGWKRVEASVSATERMYVRELHELLVATAERAAADAGGRVPGVVLHNFRSDNCCIYQF